MKALIRAKGKIYVHESSLEEEKALIRRSHVRIPFTSFDNVYALLSPLPSSPFDPQKVKDFFPSSTFSKIPFNMSFMSAPPQFFRVAP